MSKVLRYVIILSWPSQPFRCGLGHERRDVPGKLHERHALALHIRCGAAFAGLAVHERHRRVQMDLREPGLLLHDLLDDHLHLSRHRRLHRDPDGLLLGRRDPYHLS